MASSISTFATAAFDTAPEYTAPSQAESDENESERESPSSQPLLTPKDDADPIRTLYETTHSELTNLGKALTCPICQSTYAEQTVILPCVHAFCRSCITLALRSKQECPICKTTATKRGLVDCPLLGELTVAFKQVTRSLGWTPSVYSNQVDMTQLPASNSQSVAMVECHEQLQAAKVWERALNSGQDNPILQKERAKVVQINQEAMVRAAVQKKAKTTAKDFNKDKEIDNKTISMPQRHPEEEISVLEEKIDDQSDRDDKNSQRTVNFEQNPKIHETSPPLTSIITHDRSSPLRKSKRNNIYTWAADKNSDGTTSLQPTGKNKNNEENGKIHLSSADKDLTPSQTISPKQQSVNEIKESSRIDEDASIGNIAGNNFEFDNDSEASTNHAVDSDKPMGKAMGMQSKTATLRESNELTDSTNEKTENDEDVAEMSVCNDYSSDQSQVVQPPASGEVETMECNSDEQVVETESSVPNRSKKFVTTTNAAAIDNESKEQVPESIDGDCKEEVSEVQSGASLFSVGTVVKVQARTWPGINKHGGVGRVTHVYSDGAVCYDVTYVLGGREKKVDAAFVSLHQDDVDAQLEEEKRSRRGGTEEIPVSVLQALAAEGFETRRRCSPRRAKAKDEIKKNKDEADNCGKGEKTKNLKRKPVATVTNAKRGRNEENANGKAKTNAPKGSANQTKCYVPTKSKTTEKTPTKKRKSIAPANTKKKHKKEFSLKRGAKCASLADQHYDDKLQKSFANGIVHVVSSSLSVIHEEKLKLLLNLVKDHDVKLKISETFNMKKTTMVLIPSSASREAKNRTLKAMRASLAGVPLVDLSWIEYCVEKKTLVEPTTDMYIRSLPARTPNLDVKFGVALLAAKCKENSELPMLGKNVHFMERNKDAKKDVQLLLREAGANHLPSWEAMIRLLKKKEHVTLLLGKSTKLPAAKKKEIEKVKSGIPGDSDAIISIVTTNWLFDSISCGEVLPDAQYAAVN